MPQQMIRRVTSPDLSISGAPTPYECCGLFDMCTDADLMSLSFQGVDPFLDWLTWRPDTNCYIRKSFITYVGPERIGGRQGIHCSDAHLADPCEDPLGFEWGKCDFVLHDFARFRRQGPVRDITTNKMMYCANQPRYRLDGSVIVDSMELDMVMATEVLIQDLRHHVIMGSASAAGSMDGLEELLDSDYHDPEGNPCPMMNSNVINWNGNPMDGGAGITWNGQAVGAAYDLVDVLLAVYRRIRQRLSWTPQLSRGLSVGDIVLVMPTFLIQCLLDFYTCWSICPESMELNYATRTFRNGLNGGMFGSGAITLDGFTIPIIAYDWDTISGPKTGDIYFLTGKVGGVRLIEGQYLDMKHVPGEMPGSSFATTDGGRILTWQNSENTCYKQLVEMRPRLLLWAPWAEAVINDVQCAGPGGPLSPDPCATSFFPGGASMVPTSCPDHDALEVT